MKKLIVLMCVLAELSLSAMDWKSYNDALVLQEKNSKIIMLDVVRTHCQYCIKMDREVFRDKDMSKWVSERFIPVKINLDENEMPLDVEVGMTPTFYFLDKEKKLLKVIPGSWNMEDFKDLTKNIKGN